MKNDVFWIIFELLIYIVEGYIFLKIPCSILGIKCKKRTAFICFSLCYILIIINEYTYRFFGIWQNFVFFFLILTYALLCLKGTIIKKIALSLFPLFITTLVNSVIIFSYTSFFPNQISQIFLPSPWRLIAMFTSKLILVALTGLIISFGRNNQNLNTRQWILITLCFGFADLSCGLLIYSLKREQLSRNILMTFVAIIFFILIMSILVFVMITKLSHENQIKTENKLLLQEKKHQQRTLEAIRAGSQELNQIKHDINNYMLLISGLISKGEYQRALNECQAVTGKVATVTTIIETGNLSFDLLLNEKLNLCKLNSILTSCVVMADISEIDITDFSLAFSNLIDNAIEYSQTLPAQKRKIDVEISYKLGFYTLRISNYIAKSILKKNPQLKTTKAADGKSHGIGHLNVINTAEKLCGQLRYYERNNKFIAKFVFLAEADNNI